MVINSIIRLIICTTFVVFTIYIIKTTKSWHTPSSIISILWTSIIIISFSLAPDYYYSYNALLFLFSIIVMFYSGSYIVQSIFVQSKNQYHTNPIIRYKLLIILVFIGTISGFISIWLLLKTNHYDFSYLLSKNKYLALSVELTNARYKEIRLAPSVMLFLSFAYAGNLLAGFLLAISKNYKQKIYSLLSLSPLLLFTLIYTARTNFLFAIILYISSYLSTSLWIKKDKFKTFNIKRLIIILSVVVLIFILFAITQITRFTTPDFNYTISELRIRFFANISGLSIWFDTNNFINKPSYGKYSLAGLFEMLGSNKRIIGMFSEYYDVSRNGNFTNIFTIIRVVIEDFTIYGIYPIFFFIGFISTYLHKKIEYGNIIYIPYLSAFYSLILWSFIVCIFAYNSIILAFIIFIISSNFIFYRNGVKSSG